MASNVQNTPRPIPEELGGGRDATAPTAMQRKANRLLDKMHLETKNHLVAAIGEFLGTFMFLLFALGGANTVNNAPSVEDQGADPARLLYISLCFGISLVVNAWVFYRITGGLFNPAVTIGLVAIGAVEVVRGVIVIVSQLLGAIAAAAVVLGLQPGELHVSTTLAAGTSVVQGFFIETFLTWQLVLTILMLAVEKHKGTFIAPVGIGLSLFITQLMGVYHTGGSVNPARSFGPAVVTRSFPSYHWIYFLGPIFGSLLASGFYKLIKVLEYETANPGQDDDGVSPPKKKPAPLLRGATVGYALPREPSPPPSHSHSPEGHQTQTGGSKSGGGTAQGSSYSEGPNLEIARDSKTGGYM